MTCLLQPYFLLDGKYNSHKWALSSLRWRSHSGWHTCGELAFAERPVNCICTINHAEWHVICIIRLVEQLSRTPSLGSSTLRISCSANGISSVTQSTMRVYEKPSGVRTDISAGVESSSLSYFRKVFYLRQAVCIKCYKNSAPLSRDNREQGIWCQFERRQDDIIYVVTSWFFF